MSRYIDADKLKKDFENEFYYRRDDNLYLCIEALIEEAATADVVEVRHGEWAFEVKHFFDDYGDLNVYAKGYCSECKKEYPFNATIATEYVERPDDLDGYEHWDIDVEPIKEQVSHKAKTNKNLYPYCPYCGAKMDGERREENAI